MRTAEVLLHVIDATHPRWSEQQRIANVYSKTWGVRNKPTLTVFNKIDGLTQPSDGQAQHEAAFDTDDWWGAPPAGTPNGQGMSGPGCFVSLQSMALASTRC